MADIRFEEGYKDEWKVVVEPEGETWEPRNDEVFEWIRMWFHAEDQAFPDGYGSAMPYFYIGLIAIGEEEKAMEAVDLEGREALEHFRECIREHRDDIIEALPEE